MCYSTWRALRSRVRLRDCRTQMQYFDILLFAVIAGFLLVRLHRVLGRRTGHENPPPEAAASSDAQAHAEPAPPADPGREAESVERPAAERKEEGSAAARIAAFCRADPTFDPDRFLEGAKQAFSMIVEAFAGGNRELLRGLVSDVVYRSFDASMTERERDGRKIEVRNIRVTHASIADATITTDPDLGRRARVQVEFESEKIEVTRDSAGTVVDGDPDIPARANDLWTFVRDPDSSDPNWALVRTGE